MNQPTMETVVRRLDRLEQENRRLKRWGALALAVIAVVVLMGQAAAVEAISSPLIDAAKAGDAGRVRALLAAGADVNAKDVNGQTALMGAAQEGYPDIVRILKEAGARE